MLCCLPASPSRPGCWDSISGWDHLIVPAALEFLAREIVNSTVYPGANRGMQANPVAGAVEIIVDPRLDAVSTTRWYLMADPQSRDTIKLAYLNGNAELNVTDVTIGVKSGGHVIKES